MAEDTPYLIELLQNRHDRSQFSCGKEEFDTYLKRQAGQDVRRNISVCYVLVEEGGQEVCGYYTLSAFGINLADLPSEIAQRLPRYPVVPATLVGRLAIDRQHGGRRLGERLLMDALHRSLQQSEHIASSAVVVEAIDEEARAFYLHFDFLPFPDYRNRLFLPMRTIASLFR